MRNDEDNENPYINFGNEERKRHKANYFRK